MFQFGSTRLDLRQGQHQLTSYIQLLGVSLTLTLNLFPGSPQLAGSPTQKPNIVFILADDMGYGDAGCYGATNISTPNLDALAREGMLFTDFHSNGPLCTPTRAALLTGKYQQNVTLYRAQLGERYAMAKALPLEEQTFAETAKQAGYVTGLIGKWHLGDHLPYLPTRQGFDRYFGLPYSHDMHPFHKNTRWPPLPLIQGEAITEIYPDLDLLTNRYTTESIQFIRDNRNFPFLLYLAHSMPHKPIHVSDRFLGRFHSEQLAEIKGLYDDESRNFLYPAAIEEIDWSVGEIIKTLQELELEKQTLVIFSSDNGPAKNAGSAKPLRGSKGSLYEGGHRVPGIFYWPGKIPAGSTTHETAMLFDLAPTWANLMGVTIEDICFDGTDLTPILLKRERLLNRSIFVRNKGRRMVRKGPWKLLLTANKDSGEEAELFNLDQDIGEKKNLAHSMPDLIGQLRNELQTWEKSLKKGPEEEW